MKYRVIGWINQDATFPPDAEQTFAERNAVIDEIRRQKYVFSGEEHQDCPFCVPVLNNGKKFSCSRRGWGELMAEAHGYTDPFGYARFTDRRDCKSRRPSSGYSTADFVGRTALKETLDVVLNEAELYRDVKEGRTLRLPESEYVDAIASLRYLDGGDTLRVWYEGKSCHRVVASVSYERDMSENDRLDFYRDYVMNVSDQARRDKALERMNAIPLFLIVSFRLRKTKKGESK